MSSFSFPTILPHARRKFLLGTALTTSLAWTVTAVFSPPPKPKAPPAALYQSRKSKRKAAAHG